MLRLKVFLTASMIIILVISLLVQVPTEGLDTALGHPRLFFTREEISNIRAKAASNVLTAWNYTYEQIWLAIYRDALEYGNQSAPRDFSYSKDLYYGMSLMTRLETQSFAYVVTGRSIFAEKARDTLLEVCRFPTWISGLWWVGNHPSYADTGSLCVGVAVAYDWLYDFLSEEERSEVRRALIEKGIKAIYNNFLEKGPGTSKVFGSNYMHSLAADMGIAAMSLLGEDPNAENWVNFALDRMREHIIVNSDEDGAFTEGTDYGTWNLMNVVFFIDPLRRVTGIDLYAHPWIRNALYFWIYSLAPGGSPERREKLYFGDAHPAYIGPYFISPFGESAVFLRLISEYKNGHALWFLRQVWPFMSMSGSQQIIASNYHRVFNFLWVDASIEPLFPDDLPPFRHFRTAGLAVFRTGWEDKDTLFAFKSGLSERTNFSLLVPNGTRFYTDLERSTVGHAHADQNSFVINYRGEWLATDPGWRHTGVWPDEHYDRYASGTVGHNSILVDGQGQSGGVWWNAEGKNGKIVRFVGSDFFGYVAGEAAEAYPGLLRSFLRHVAYSIESNYFVVLDELKAEAPKRFDWLLHTRGEVIVGPSVGTFVLVPSKTSLISTVKEAIVLSEYNRLLVKVVLPDPFKYNITAYPGLESLHNHYLVINPSERTAATHFLVLLIPQHLSYQGWVPKFQSSTLINTNSTLGLRVQIGDVNELTLFKVGNISRLMYEGLEFDGQMMFKKGSLRDSVRYVMYNGTWLKMNNTVYFSSSVQATPALEYKGDFTLGSVTVQREGNVKIYHAEEPTYVVLDGVGTNFTYDSEAQLVNVRLNEGYHELLLASESGYEHIKSLLMSVKAEVEKAKLSQVMSDLVQRALRLLSLALEGFDRGDLYSAVRNSEKTLELARRIEVEGAALRAMEEASQAIRKAERLEGRVVGIENAKKYFEQAKEALLLEDYAAVVSLAGKAKEAADKAETYLKAYGHFLLIGLIITVVALFFLYRRILKGIRST